MPIVTMPDGTNVRFPDDMPREQIRGLIAGKFPDAPGIGNSNPRGAGMATLNINGRRVNVDDTFLALPPEQQETTVNEIAASMQGSGRQAVAKALAAKAPSPASHVTEAHMRVAQALMTPTATPKDGPSMGAPQPRAAAPEGPWTQYQRPQQTAAPKLPADMTNEELFAARDAHKAVPMEVEGPDGTIYEFPAGTSREVMSEALQRRYPKPGASPNAAAPPDFPTPRPAGLGQDDPDAWWKSAPLVDPQPMQTFEVEVDGKRYEVQARTMEAAAEAARTWNPAQRGAIDNAKARMDAAEGGYGFMDAVRGSLPFGDEVVGAAGAVGGLLTGRTSSLSEGYDQAVARERAGREAYAEQHPFGSAAATVSATLPTLATRAGTTVASLPGAAWQAAKEAGFWGGVFGAGEGTGADERVQNAFAGAGTGAAIGGAAGLGAGLIGRAISRKSGQDASAVARQVEADQFGVPLTKGQATADPRRLAFEEAARKGGQPDMANRAVASFDQGQADAMRAAEGRIAEGFGGSVPSPEAALEGALDGYRRNAAAAKASANRAYDDVGPAFFDRNAVEIMPAQVRRSLVDGSVIVDDTLTPAAARALKELDELGNLNVVDRAAPGGAGAKAGISLEGVNQVRKRLGGLSGSTPEDRRAMTAIRRSFDDWLDNSADTALLAGDEKAVEALRTANSEWAAYRRTYTPRANDDAARLFNRIANATDEAPVSAQEVANALWGSAQVGAKGVSPRLALRLRAALGDGPEWAGIRQGTWMKVVEPPTGQDARTPAAIAKRIQQFVEGDGLPTARVLFSQAEREKMAAYARVLKHTETPRNLGNPSQTAYRLAAAGRSMLTAISGALGFSTGGWAGAAAGAAASHAALSVSGALRASSATKRFTPRAQPFARTTQGILTGAPRAGAPAFGAIGMQAMPAAAEPETGPWTQYQQQGNAPRDLFASPRFPGIPVGR